MKILISNLLGNSTNEISSNLLKFHWDTLKFDFEVGGLVEKIEEASLNFPSLEEIEEEQISFERADQLKAIGIQWREYVYSFNISQFERTLLISNAVEVKILLKK